MRSEGNLVTALFDVAAGNPAGLLAFVSACVLAWLIFTK